MQEMLPKKPPRQRKPKWTKAQKDAREAAKMKIQQQPQQQSEHLQSRQSPPHRPAFTMDAQGVSNNSAPGFPPLGKCFRAQSAFVEPQAGGDIHPPALSPYMRSFQPRPTLQPEVQLPLPIRSGYISLDPKNGRESKTTSPYYGCNTFSGPNSDLFPPKRANHSPTAVGFTGIRRPHTVSSNDPSYFQRTPSFTLDNSYHSLVPSQISPRDGTTSRDYTPLHPNHPLGSQISSSAEASTSFTPFDRHGSRASAPYSSTNVFSSAVQPIERAVPGHPMHLRKKGVGKGAPKPNGNYIKCAMRPSQLLPRPQPLLLVLDLNGTLLHRPNRAQSSKFQSRPFANTFLQYALASYTVMIWSSARPENVALMCAQLVPSSARSQIVAEWGRDRLGLTAAEYNAKVQVYKRLEEVWSDPVVSKSHPSGGVWDQGNTVLIDDTTLKAAGQPWNLIELPEFKGASRETDGRVLRQLVEYLEILRVQSDVSSYMRIKPFKFAGVVGNPSAEEVAN